jgi:NADH-quinone oxidoreductase subunit J
MSLPVFVFFLFAVVTVAAAVMVIAARNPVHSVLFLILAFFNAAGMFVLAGAEFLAMLLVIVYVGAVAVLFLFVVMMLNINYVRLREGFLQYLPVGGLIGLVLLVELILVLSAWVTTPTLEAAAQQPTPPIETVTNTEALGDILYTQYVYIFLAAGLILLVAMVGAIALTLRELVGVRRQDIGSQVHRPATIELRKVTPGSGV